MEIKGTFFAAQRDTLIREFGDRAWAELEGELHAISPLFCGPVTGATLVPLDDYIRFQEAWLDHFYAGDEREYWHMGAAMAGWALVHGPYRHLLAGARAEAVPRILARLWRAYASEGAMVVAVEDGRIDVEVRSVGAWHLCVEYTAMGFAEKTIELATRSLARPRRIYGEVEGEVEGEGEGEGEHKLGCRYRFDLGRALQPSALPKCDPAETVTRRLAALGQARASRRAARR